MLQSARALHEHCHDAFFMLSYQRSMASTFTTSDGVRLSYTEAGPANGPVILLLHGWSGSRRYFDLNVPGLAAGGCRVVALDQRFHGDSDSPAWGFHVARLAADAHELITHLQLTDITAVGTSMGSSVIWSLMELFGQQRFKGCVFVDQAPLQNRAADWKLGSLGCYDEASLAKLQQELLSDVGLVADGNAASCLSQQLPDDVAAMLKAETLKCSGRALGALMADHTAADWRPILPRLSMPCLNLVGGDGKIFHHEGVKYVGTAVPDCATVVFERCGHWLYLEQPQDFNTLLLDFMEKRNEGRPKHSTVA